VEHSRPVVQEEGHATLLSDGRIPREAVLASEAMSPSPAGRPGSAARAIALGLVLLVLAGCGQLLGTEPPATPTDFPGLTGRLRTAGIVLGDTVSGDAGCTDPDLVPASISTMASGLDQKTPVKLYLYIFRNREAWERQRASIGSCAQAWVTDPQTYEELEESPYVLAGQGPWAPEFEAALRTVLAQAAGTGD
jgi:hypothetical protein